MRWHEVDQLRLGYVLDDSAVSEEILRAAQADVSAARRHELVELVGETPVAQEQEALFSPAVELSGTLGHGSRCAPRDVRGAPPATGRMRKSSMDCCRHSRTRVCIGTDSVVSTILLMPLSEDLLSYDYSHNQAQSSCHTRTFSIPPDLPFVGAAVRPRLLDTLHHGPRLYSAYRST